LQVTPKNDDSRSDAALWLEIEKIIKLPSFKFKNSFINLHRNTTGLRRATLTEIPTLKLADSKIATKFAYLHRLLLFYIFVE